MTACTGVLPDPRTIAEAIDSQRPDATLWKIAIDNEFQSLVDKGVYAEALLPPGARALGTRPLLVTKRDGTKKCRIVAQGFSQVLISTTPLRQSVDTPHSETSSPYVQLKLWKFDNSTLTWLSSTPPWTKWSMLAHLMATNPQSHAQSGASSRHSTAFAKHHAHGIQNCDPNFTNLASR